MSKLKVVLIAGGTPSPSRAPRRHSGPGLATGLDLSDDQSNHRRRAAQPLTKAPNLRSTAMATATTERALANRLFSGASHSCKDTPLSCGGFSAAA